MLVGVSEFIFLFFLSACICFYAGLFLLKIKLLKHFWVFRGAYCVAAHLRSGEPVCAKKKTFFFHCRHSSASSIISYLRR